MPSQERQEQLIDRFAYACNLAKVVQVIYRAHVPDDPALPETLRRDGIVTTVQGKALRLDEHGLHIEPVVVTDEPIHLHQCIAWDRVLDLMIREVEA